MAITFVKRSEIPAAVIGNVSTSPRVTVGANGALVFNSFATKALGNADNVALVVDKDTRKITFLPPNHPSVKKQGLKPEDLFVLKHPKSGKKNGKTAILSGSANILNNLFETRYDYRHSGSQTFDATVDEKTGAISFTLPVKMEPKPIVQRAKRKTNGANGAVAGNKSNGGAQVPPPPAQDDLLEELESA
jgi:hypothetical protein